VEVSGVGEASIPSCADWTALRGQSREDRLRVVFTTLEAHSRLELCETFPTLKSRKAFQRCCERVRGKIVWGDREWGPSHCPAGQRQGTRLSPYWLGPRLGLHVVPKYGIASRVPHHDVSDALCRTMCWRCCGLAHLHAATSIRVSVTTEEVEYVLLIQRTSLNAIQLPHSRTLPLELVVFARSMLLRILRYIFMSSQTSTISHRCYSFSHCPSQSLN
jgi:hypothetical protein